MIVSDSLVNLHAVYGGHDIRHNVHASGWHKFWNKVMCTDCLIALLWVKARLDEDPQAASDFDVPPEAIERTAIADLFPGEAAEARQMLSGYIARERKLAKVAKDVEARAMAILMDIVTNNSAPVCPTPAPAASVLPLPISMLLSSAQSGHSLIKVSQGRVRCTKCFVYATAKEIKNIECVSLPFSCAK